MKKLSLFLVLILVLSVFAACGTTKEEKTVVIGGKNYTEQEILVYLMRDIIEAKTDVKVVTKPFLGGTQVVFAAMKKGDLDIYAEYTGTALLSILKQDLDTDTDRVYNTVKDLMDKDHGLAVLKPFGFNNTYALAMKAEKAESLGIKTYSDLAAKSGDLVIAGTQEFLERKDGYMGLKETYGMNFKSTKGMDPGLTYAAVRDGQVDVNSAFATDGRIAAFNLTVLEDDKNFFPPYYATPVIRKDTLEKYPEVKDALEQLAGKLDDKTMSDLNAQVDLNKKDAKVVANEWLKSQGLID
ncbi:ABC transporter substrate-binding protein [Anaeromicrobium sediminis]|uniref:Glycine/betaine ABC transporter substrate-binding protein n=1 Tax=Anaeromicrobium sediminis TaxID=1478221 RepID=A0A267MCY5_9FIRM|nr:glycine betaine ABC transporter substrate-binding protein [Anaeromicrobium sediminis]PAB57242.1 glycine/betaine ABC transporter substrate-binding protein [Anaeromicrobium sediminis]